MAKIPDEILRHRLKGTEIKQVGGRYYIQRVSSRWIPEIKASRKIYGEHLGTVTPEGIVPRRARLISAAARPYSLEFGATWTVGALTGDIREQLEAHIGADAGWVYAAALLRCVHPCAMRYLEHAYSASYLSVSLPGLRMSSQELSTGMKALGTRRREMAAFMRTFIPDGDWFAIFDGTSMVCNSKNIHEAQRGYNTHGRHDPQINLMYALAHKADGIAPVFYKRYPGSVRDISAFRNMATEMGLKAALILADKGFASRAGLDRIEHEEGLSYIMPLRRNSLDYSRDALNKPGRTGFDGRFQHNGRIIWFQDQPATPGARHKCCLYLDETLCHMESTSVGIRRVGKETPDEARASALAQLVCGTFVLRTNLLDMPPEKVYTTYKSREEVEQLFDTYKCEEQFATTCMYSSETQEACLFINHLCVMMLYRVYNRLKQSGGLKEYAAQKSLELILKDIRVSRIGDDDPWQLEPVPKAARLVLEAIGLTLPQTP